MSDTSPAEVIVNLTAEDIARAFHATYEHLAPQHGYETRKESAVDWSQVPENNRHLMIHVVERLLETGFIHPGTKIARALRAPGPSRPPRPAASA